MAILKVEQNVLPQTLRLLLQLANDPNDVRFTHGVDGSEVHVPDALALEFVQALQQIDSPPDTSPKLNGHTPPPPSTPSKKAKR